MWEEQPKREKNIPVKILALGKSLEEMSGENEISNGSQDEEDTDSWRGLLAMAGVQLQVLNALDVAKTRVVSLHCNLGGWPRQMQGNQKVGRKT
ncbi:hypothetical protein RJ639_023980 [Escallonia herrerae]|uniref:Uncharacterized protein n=1 Tax=Escallonia herrerae TaxID=1293975 RepID=A0AA89ACR3_9ASTE|nr:hypothetical protein RJ639_023980 [Escallonia herrerae]